VHPCLRTPVWAIVITSALAVAITVYAAVYRRVVISTVTLYLAYVIPSISTGATAARPRRVRDSGHGPWSLDASARP